MVRRWSHINYFNKIKFVNFQNVYEGSFDFNVNSNMYLRKHFSGTTTLTRRKWARRKHLTSWLALSMVMSDWSRSYRFNRQILKTLYVYSLTKSTVVAFSTLGFKNSLPSLHKNTENVVLSSISKKFIYYFNNCNQILFNFFRNYKNLNLTFIAFAATPNFSSIDNDSTMFINLLISSFGTLTPANKNLKKTLTSSLCTAQLMSLPSYMFTATLVPLYNTLVLLTAIHSFKLM